MAYLNEEQWKLINDLNVLGTPKTVIAKTVHCCRDSVYYQLEKINPRDGSAGTFKRRERRKGGYKLTEQIKANILEYVLNHKFCTNKEIMVELQLNLKSKQSISNVLKEMGIGSYVAVTKQYISLVNKNKR